MIYQRKILNFHLPASKKILLVLSCSIFLGFSIFSVEPIKAQDYPRWIGSTWHYYSPIRSWCESGEYAAQRREECATLSKGVLVPVRLNRCIDYGNRYGWEYSYGCACDRPCIKGQTPYLPFLCKDGWSGNPSLCQQATPTIRLTPSPKPTPTSIPRQASCYQPCSSNQDCQGSLVCGYHVNAGGRVCHNRYCANERNCICAWEKN